MLQCIDDLVRFKSHFEVQVLCLICHCIALRVRDVFMLGILVFI